MNPSILCKEWQHLRLIQHYHLADTTLENWWETTLFLLPYNLDLWEENKSQVSILSKKKKSTARQSTAIKFKAICRTLTKLTHYSFSILYVQLPSLCYSTNQFLPQPEAFLNFRCSQHLLSISVEKQTKKATRMVADGYWWKSIDYPKWYFCQVC